MAATFDLGSFIQSVKSELARLGSRVSAVEHVNLNVPTADPNNRLHANINPASDSCRVLAGYVVSSLPVYNWYKVQLDQGGYVACSLGSLSGHTKSSAKDISTLPPYSRVFVILSSLMDYGTIISSSYGRNPTSFAGVRDSISQASAHTMATEGFIDAAVSDPGLMVSPFTQHAPMDATGVGEWGCTTDNGTGVFCDPFMAFLRADENCGVWAFWHDQLLRLHGHNLQVRSPAFGMYSFNDEDELSVIKGYSPYLWEALGGLTPGLLSTARTFDEVQTTSPEFGVYDLLDKKQTPFHRLLEFYGFLGQGFRKQLRLPPSSGTIYSIGSKTETSAVWEESLSLDGNYHMVSSQGLFLAHVPPFRALEQNKLPEDGTGDSRSSGYDPAGNGSTQVIRTGKPNIANIEGTGSALLADDELAYGLRWRAGHPFHYHSADWEKDTQSNTEAKSLVSSLSNDQYLPKPEPTNLKVDHRETSADYHKTLSYVSVLRDGTVVIAGPAGEEIRMGGGSIEITCPGDIQLRPGRNMVVMSGRDSVIKAKGNVELSATDEDVRIKAERNMQLLAANSGFGGMLIESRSEQQSFDYTKTGSEIETGGLVLKSNSVLSCMGSDVYIRSGVDGSNGSVIVDAAKGAGTVITTADTTLNYNKTAIVDYFGSPSDIKSFNQFSDKQTSLSGGIKAYDGVGATINGSVTAKSNLVALKGSIAAGNTTGYVAELATEDSKRNEAAFEEALQGNKDQVKQASKRYKSTFTDSLYSDNNIGNDQVLQTMTFSFRSSSQSRADGFKMFESRWAQRARALGDVTDVWQEKPVKANEVSTYPYPGAEAWLGDNYTKVDSTLYTVQTDGKLGPKPSGVSYESNQENPISNVSPEGNYPVIG